MSNGTSFQVPNGYVEESITPQLFYEDLDEESEIWLIRMPHDLNPAVIENEKITLDGNQHTIYCDEDFRVEYISDTVEQTKLNLILPQKSDGKLRNVEKEFKGSVFFNEDIVLENIEVKMEDESAENNVQNVSSSSVLCDDFENSVALEKSNNLHSSVESKKSKKKKKTPSKIKKEKGSDVDDFPSCNSQR